MTGTTDNLGNTWALIKLMSTKYPLLVVLGELATQLDELSASLELAWVPRDQNEEADALTNGDFSAFDPERRVEIDVGNLKFKILPQLAKVAEELYRGILERRGARPAGAGRRSRPARLKERDPWE